MSVSTIVTIKCQGFALNKETFLKLDNCFAIEKLRPDNRIRVYSELPIGWEKSGNIYKDVKTDFDLAEREIAIRRGVVMYSTYISEDNQSVIVDVTLNYDALLTCAEIRLDATTEPRSVYAKEQINCARGLYNISLRLHNTFEAVDTSAIVDVWPEDAEPWFHFSKSEWKTADFPLAEE